MYERDIIESHLGESILALNMVIKYGTYQAYCPVNSRNEKGYIMSDIFRTIKNKNYTVMSNHHLQNPNLSLKAMGLMSKVLSLPDDWKYSVRGLAAYCRDGYESVRTALCELEAEGYLVRKQIRNERGQILHTEYIFRESPDMEIPEVEREAVKKVETSEESEKKEETEDRINTGFLPGLENPILDEKKGKNSGEPDWKKQKPPGSDYPTTGYPTTKNPSLGNRRLQNTNKQNNNIINTKRQKNITSSSVSGQEKRSGREEGEEKQTVRKVKKQIGYDLLRPKYGQDLLDEVVNLMAEVYLPKRAAALYTISQRRVEREALYERLSILGQEHVAAVLEGIRSGPPIRNVRKYLLTALYQADTALHINQIRKEQPEKKNKFNNFHQRSYDFGELEKKLLQQ